jgi:hypothetical protein
MTSRKISYSSELMTNYMQAEVMRPETGFRALQTASGAALLFSIGTDKVLYATAETAGDRHGWRRHDLSSARIAEDFAGQTGVVCKNFCASQCVDQSIHLAMVVDGGANDHLYLSLKNSASDTSWVGNPVWTAFPYDDPDHARPKVEIVGVFLSQASDGEYIVVDVIRDAGTSTIFRYYIDPDKKDGHAWWANDVSTDIQSGKYSSCLGRKANQGAYPVDGIYTAGQIDGTAQLEYRPLYNPFTRGTPGDTAPNPNKLDLPGHLVPDAIAACRNADNTSDLYVAAGGKLFWFASDRLEVEDGQAQANAVAVQVAENKLFAGALDLFAFTTEDNKVMVWGRNTNNEIFYITCPLDKLTEHPGAWSVPLPLLSGVEQVSPFMNRAHSANSFFAKTGEGKLTRAVKSPGTSLWTFSDITLPPPDTKAKARSFDSYTTRIMVNDDNGMPLGHTKVKLSTTGALTTVYINHIYYIVGQRPIEVETDAAGTLTLVESTRTLSATQFRIDAGGGTASVNPMEQPMRRLAVLTTRDKLKDATIRYQDGSTRKLVSGDVNDDDLSAIAKANTQMGEIYDSLAKQHAPAAMVAAAALTASVIDRPMVVSESHGGIIADIGDFLAWLGDRIRHGFEAAIEFVKDIANDVWNAVVRIAGEIHRVVIKVVEDVVEFATWVYNKIKVAVEDVIKYVSFIFDIDDMRRTKEVFKHTIKLYLQHQVDGIDTFKSKFDALIDEAQAQVSTWAGLAPTFSGLGADGNSAVSKSSSYQHSDSATASFLIHHYQGNAANATFDPEPAGHQPSLLDPLLNAVKQEYAAMQTVVTRIEGLAKELPRLSALDILKRLLGVIAEFGLASVKTIADALLDVLKVVISGIVKAIDTPFYIPVVTDILEAFGVPRFSILDLLCWIAAAATTIVYKLATSKAPFPDDQRTADLLQAPTYDRLVALLHAAPEPEYAARSLGAAAAPAPGPDWLNEYRRMIHIAGQFASGLFTAIPGAIADAAEVAASAIGNPFGKHSAAIAVFAGCTNGIATTLSPYEPLQDNIFVTISRVTTGLRIFVKLAFGGWAFAAEKAALDPKGDEAFLNNLRIAGAVIDVILIIPALAASIKHFIELADKAAGGKRSIAIVNEVGNLTGYVGRICYLGAASTQGIPKAVFIGVMTGASVCTGGLLIADAFIEPD